MIPVPSPLDQLTPLHNGARNGTALVVHTVVGRVGFLPE